MAKAPISNPSASHYRLKVKAPINASGMQFNPGIAYTVKAAIYNQIKDVAVDVAPIIKD